MTSLTRHWDAFAIDARHAVRMLLKTRALSLIAVSALALGTGANIAIYSALRGVLLRPLPYAQPWQLVALHQQMVRAGRDDMSFSVAEIDDYRRSTRAIESLAEYFVDQYVLQDGLTTDKVQTGVVSSNFFDLLGVTPILGRAFAAADQRAGGAAVALVSHDYWRRTLGGGAEAIGRRLTLNNQVFTVIGVLPPLPPYPDDDDVYITNTSSAFRMWPDRIRNRNRRFARVLARLTPGTTLDQANSDLATVAAGLARQYPESYPAAAGYRTIAVPVREEVSRRARPSLWLLTGGALFILTIACANVANATVARLAERAPELAMRAALGASRLRIFRQLVTEAAILSAVAVGMGLVLAVGSLDLLRQLFAGLTPLARDVALDGSALGVAFAMVVLTSIVTAGLVALSLQRRTARPIGTRQLTADARQSRIGRGLLVAQVAFSLVLLGSAGLMLQSLRNLQRVDSGVARDGVLAIHLAFSTARYPTPADQRTAGADIVRAAAMLPGVVSAAVGSSFPLDPEAVAFGVRGDWNRYQIEGRPGPAGEPAPVTAFRIVSADYFRTLGIPLLRGRTFGPSDTPSVARVVAVNHAFARHRLDGVEPVGTRISSDGGASWLTIVGVVGNTAELDLRDTAADEVYDPIDQLPAAPSGDWVRTLLVRTAVAPSAFADTIRRVIDRTAPQVAASRVITLDEARTSALTSPRVTTGLLTLFAVVALVVAVAGMSGMLMVSVSRRVKEIGIRRALGAQAADVLVLVVSQELTTVALGLAAGLVLAALVGRVLRAFLFQIAPTDWGTLGAVCAVFGLATLVAWYVPIARALDIEPNIALRHD